jgi:hypothetical protein
MLFAVCAAKNDFQRVSPFSRAEGKAAAKAHAAAFQRGHFNAPNAE